MPEPKKSLGQHWLHDQKTLNSIADAAQIKPGESVLEIGPGLGTLSEVLISKGADLSALEFDQDLITKLESKFSGRAHIIFGDIRKFDLTQMPIGYKVVANIPYYLTSHLVRLLSESSNPPDTSVLLVQKEVAERICASPGQMSLLSFVAQWNFECSLGLIVPASLFRPPPKVDSQVVIMKSRKFANVENEKLLLRIVKAGFSERRKTLTNSLSAGLRMSKDEISETLKTCGIDAMSRAQALSLNDWLNLYRTLKSKTV